MVLGWAGFFFGVLLLVLVWFGLVLVLVLDHLRACFENSSINSSRSLFLGILPTNSR